MAAAASSYFQELEYNLYPSIIIQAVTTVIRGTAVLYLIPYRIMSDLQSLAGDNNCYLHCIVSHFRGDANEHIFTFLPTGRLPPYIYSPEIIQPIMERESAS